MVKLAVRSRSDYAVGEEHMIIMETADNPEASSASFPSKSLPRCIARAFIEGLKFFLEAYIAVISLLRWKSLELSLKKLGPSLVILLAEG